MYTYGNFEKDARAIFHEIIGEYSLSVKATRTRFQMSNSQYKIYFVANPFELSGHIQNIKTREIITLKESNKDDLPDIRSIQDHLVWELNRYKVILTTQFHEVLLGI